MIISFYKIIVIKSQGFKPATLLVHVFVLCIYMYMYVQYVYVFYLNMPKDYFHIVNFFSTFSTVNIYIYNKHLSRGYFF